AAWRRARSTPGTGEEAQLALAMSGFVVGSEAAVADLKTADVLWQARDLVEAYLGGREGGGRAQLIEKLDALHWPGAAGSGEGLKKLDLVSRMVVLMPPPLHDGSVEAEKTMVRKVIEDQNEAPTEYAVRLPLEYHPLRSYPAVVVLHGSQGPESSLEAW